MEDRELTSLWKFFKRKIKYLNGYLTKCEFTYYNIKDLKKTLEINPYLKLIWTVRDPRDMILSKIRRGQPKSKGGELKGIASDATPKSSVQNIFQMYKYYLFLKENFPKRVYLIRMEDIIRNIKEETIKMCKFLNLEFEKSMINFMDRVRNKFKKKRYNGLDKGQIALWKRWDEVYNGFFTKYDYPLEDLFEKVDEITDYFNYENA